MEHKEYIRLVDGSRTALLCIHGIVGTPDHFDSLLPLVPGDWSIFNILLDGHGGSAEDFSRSSMAKWEAQTEGWMERLYADYDRIYIAAHSMGTLFAVEAALRYDDRVKALFLMAPPLRVGLRLNGIVNSLCVVFGCTPEDDPLAVATKNACSIQPTLCLWRYLGWIPRYLELFAKIRQVRGELPELKTPCVAFHSWKDELVSNRTYKVLKKHSQIKTLVLPNSGHFYYSDEDFRLLVQEFEKMCR